MSRPHGPVPNALASWQESTNALHEICNRQGCKLQVSRLCDSRVQIRIPWTFNTLASRQRGVATKREYRKITVHAVRPSSAESHRLPTRNLQHVIFTDPSTNINDKDLIEIRHRESTVRKRKDGVKSGIGAQLT